MPAPIAAAAAATAAKGGFLSSIGGLSGVGSVLSGIGSIGGLFGGNKGPGFTEQLNHSLTASRKHMELQNDLGFRTKIAAGRKEGIHPLAMLGVNTSGQVVSPSYDTGDVKGQNLARAASAAGQTATSIAANKLALERAQLENDLLRVNISNASQNAGQTPISTQKAAQDQYSTLPDENTTRSSSDPGLTAGSNNPPPGGKKFTVGKTPYGNVYINLPPSGQADEYGELYGAAKGLEYMLKRGYVHYSNGSYRAGRLLGKKIRKIIGKDK